MHRYTWVCAMRLVDLVSTCTCIFISEKVKFKIFMMIDKSSAF